MPRNKRNLLFDFVFFISLLLSPQVFAQSQPNIPLMTAFQDLPSPNFYPTTGGPFLPGQFFQSITAPIVDQTTLVGKVAVKPMYFRQVIPGSCSQPFEIQVGGAFLMTTPPDKLSSLVQSELKRQEHANAALALTTSLKMLFVETLGPINTSANPQVAMQQFLASQCPAACRNQVKARAVMYKGFKSNTQDVLAFGMNRASIFFERIVGRCQ